MGRRCPVPLELRGEERVIGNVMSLRQAGYLGAGLVVGAVAFFPIRTVGLAVQLPPGLVMILSLLPAVFVEAVAVVLAFAPAGALGILPGPQSGPSPDPHDPPMRLDEWLLLAWRVRHKPKRMPFRRRPVPGLVNPLDRQGGERP